MQRIRRMGGMFVGLVVIAAIGATVALAVSANNPIWNVEGSDLAAGKTEAVQGQANGAQLLTTSGVSISCNSLAIIGGLVHGAALPGPGTGSAEVEYGECSVQGADETLCKINGAAIGKGTIKTAPLTSRLAYLTKAAAESELIASEETVTVFKPASPSLFAEFTLAGTCPVPGPVTVEGSGIVMKNLGKNESLELHETEAPVTALTKYFENVSGTAKEVKGIKLEVGGSSATFSGKAKFKLTAKKKWRSSVT